MTNFLPIHKPLQQWILREEERTSSSPEDETAPSCSSVHPGFPELTVSYLISQFEPNDLVRDLDLSKSQADLLVSHLKGWNLLQKLVKVPYRKSQKSPSSFLSKERRSSLL
jgi:hypothetical protein